MPIPPNAVQGFSRRPEVLPAGSVAALPAWQGQSEGTVLIAPVELGARDQSRAYH